MVYINEWYPNPPGADTAGEFVELFNTSSSSANLNGWTLSVGGKSKPASLTGHKILARGFLLLNHSSTKLTLKNSAGELFLYDARGALIDHATFTGNAPEGKSFSRADYNAGPGTHFLFSDPTPGASNAIPIVKFESREYPRGAPLNHGFTATDFLAIMLGTAIVTTALFLYILKHHEDLSKLFFRRNPTLG